MTERIELRGYGTRVKGSTLTARKGDNVVRVRLDKVTSVLYTRVNRLPENAIRIGVLFILIPWILLGLNVMFQVHILLAVLSNIFGLGLIIGYHTVLIWALDIETEDRTYLITGRKKVLLDLREAIDGYRSAHGQEQAVAEDRALDSDDDVYDRIDSATEDDDVSMYDDIDACVRCGSRDLGMASIAEGGVPGVFDVSGQIVCRNCGLVAPALCFDNEEDYGAHIASLKEEGKIDSEGKWIEGSEDAD